MVRGPSFCGGGGGGLYFFDTDPSPPSLPTSLQVTLDGLVMNCAPAGDLDIPTTALVVRAGAHSVKNCAIVSPSGDGVLVGVDAHVRLRHVSFVVNMWHGVNVRYEGED